MNELAEFFIQLTGIVVGALIVVYQLGRQHRDSLELQQENLKTERRLALFDSITEKIADAGSAISEVSVWGSFLPTAIRLQWEQARMVPAVQPALLRYRSSDLLDRYQRASRTVIAVISTIEYREVIDPALVIFRYAIAQQLESFNAAFQTLYSTLGEVLPLDPPAELAQSGVEPRNLRQATEEDAENIEEQVRRIQSESWTLQTYLTDLSREAQNRLLGPLFGTRLQPRQPVDPNVIVISTEREVIEKVERQLGIAQHVHPEGLPSRVLFPEPPRGLRARITNFRQALSPGGRNR